MTVSSEFVILQRRPPWDASSKPMLYALRRTKPLVLQLCDRRSEGLPSQVPLGPAP